VWEKSSNFCVLSTSISFNYYYFNFFFYFFFILVKRCVTVNMLGFSIGSLPFNYLGAPIFKGRPKKIYFQHILDKVKLKLANWKASLLSIAGRVHLVKAVVQSMLLHTMSIYAWPVSLIRDIEKWIKNFIWSGDITKRKMVIVAWKKICASYDEGGLNVRSLICLNEATNLKLCLDTLHSKEQWAVILRSRVLRGVNCINHHIFSSLWSSIKHELLVLKDNSTWLIGNGKHINFWHDDWCGGILIQNLNVNTNLIAGFSASVCDYICNFRWYLPPILTRSFPSLSNLVHSVTLPMQDQNDSLET
jgi:hypothetical protein